MHKKDVSSICSPCNMQYNQCAVLHVLHDMSSWCIMHYTPSGLPCLTDAGLVAPSFKPRRSRGVVVGGWTIFPFYHDDFDDSNFRVFIYFTRLISLSVYFMPPTNLLKYTCTECPRTTSRWDSALSMFKANDQLIVPWTLCGHRISTQLEL